MKKKSDLYHLINAMSKSEKRYFTVDVQKSNKKGSRYLELFHTITNMEDYDENALKIKFGKKLPHDKRYLYDAILRSMRDYRSSNSLSAQIREMILDAKYLFERELYEQCESRLNKAEELATELDEQTTLLEIFKEKRKLVLGIRKPDFHNTLLQYAESSENISAKLREELFFQDLYESLVFDFNNRQKLKDEEDKVNLKNRFLPILNAPTPKSKKALHRYYQCIALYHQLLGDDDAFFQHYSNVVDWWEKNQKYKEEEFYRYIVDISNLLHAYASKGKYSQLPELLSRIEIYSPKNIHDKGVLFEKVAIYKLLYHINTGDITNVTELMDQIDKGLFQFTIKPRSRLVIIFNMAVLLFTMENMKDCSEWCLRIIKKEKTQSRLDIRRAAYLLYLVSEFTSEDPEKTEKDIRAVRRGLKNTGLTEKTAFEYEVLSHINLINNAAIGDIKTAMKKFQLYLKNLKAAGSRIPLGTDELLLFWVNSKIERKPIRTLLGWD